MHVEHAAGVGIEEVEEESASTGDKDVIAEALGEELGAMSAHNIRQRQATRLNLQRIFEVAQECGPLDQDFFPEIVQEDELDEGDLANIEVGSDKSKGSNSGGEEV